MVDIGCLIFYLIFLPRYCLSVYLIPGASKQASGQGKIINSNIDKGYKRIHQQAAFFKDDQEISSYLKIFDRQVLIWKCKNAIQMEWKSQHPLPHIELMCNVIGDVKSVTWYHNNRPIMSRSEISKSHNHLDHQERFSQIISPHANRHRLHHYTRWTNFRLRINNATSRDSGLYLFRVSSQEGSNDRHIIYVDISDERWRNERHSGIHKNRFGH